MAEESRISRAFRNVSIWEVALALILWALIALLVIPNFLSRGSAPRFIKENADLASLRSAIDQFRLDCGRYPSAGEGFGALRQPPAGIKGWHGPYLQRDVPLDRWGRPYIYKRPGQNGKTGYLVESYGADGVPGGEGDDEDIVDGSD